MAHYINLSNSFINFGHGTHVNEFLLCNVIIYCVSQSGRKRFNLTSDKTSGSGKHLIPHSVSHVNKFNRITMMTRMHRNDHSVVRSENVSLIQTLAHIQGEDNSIHWFFISSSLDSNRMLTLLLWNAKLMKKLKTILTLVCTKFRCFSISHQLFAPWITTQSSYL